MAGNEVATDVEPASGRFPLAKIALGAAAVAGLLVLGRALGASIPVFAAWVDSLGFWGPAVFVLGYSAAVVAFVPASLLTLAGGAIFGIGAGVAYVFAAATLGSCAAFLVSRHLARRSIERRLEGNERF